MLKYQERSIKLGAALLTALALQLSSIPAQAGIYRGHFDPVYFNGFVDINVPDSCVNNDPGYHLLLAGPVVGSCGSVDILGGTVTFTPPPPPSPISITFGTFTNLVDELWWNNGTLEAIAALPPFGPSLVPSGYYMGFAVTPVGSPVVTSLTATVTLYTIACDGDCILTPVVGDVATQQGFALIPEPGSLALILGALGASWLGWRRRRGA